MPLTESTIGGLPVITASTITVPHAFTTRVGGASCGIYESLNLGHKEGDCAEHVRRNYNILATAIGFDPDKIVFTHQVHGSVVRVAQSHDRQAPFARVPYDADGLVTAEKGVPLMIFSADCVPILLHDPVRGAVGAVHAGWRGTVSDIVGNAVRTMTQAFDCNPTDIRAAIGPCISQCCFETDEDVKQAVLNLLEADARTFIKPRGDKYFIDLKGINNLLLRRAGLLIPHIEVSDECTSCSCDKYWSHRASKGQRGCQAAVILLKG